MTTIERVARALCGEGEFKACCGKCSLRLDQARTAIAAMREPSDTANKAATDLVWEFDVNVQSRNTFAAEIWQAMIDAALAEGQPA